MDRGDGCLTMTPQEDKDLQIDAGATHGSGSDGESHFFPPATLRPR